LEAEIRDHEGEESSYKVRHFGFQNSLHECAAKGRKNDNYAYQLAKFHVLIGRIPANPFPSTGFSQPQPRRSAISRSSSRRVSNFSPDASILSLIRRSSLPSFETAGFAFAPFFRSATLLVVVGMTSL
jgi:hypothetical protein